MDECPVTGQSPQGCCRNPDPAVDPDYGLARKPLSAPQNLVTLAPLLLSATIRWPGAATWTEISIGTRDRQRNHKMRAFSIGTRAAGW